MSKRKAQPQNQNLRPPKMEHIRHVKPEFFKHEKVNDLSVGAQLAWIGLWVNSDKNGVFEWKPRVLKLNIFPYRDIDIEPLLLELTKAGFIEKYTVDGQDYGISPKWKLHQHIGNREEASQFHYPLRPTQAGLSQLQAMPQGVGQSVGKGKDDGVDLDDGPRAAESKHAEQPKKSTAQPKTQSIPRPTDQNQGAGKNGKPEPPTPVKTVGELFENWNGDWDMLSDGQFSGTGLDEYEKETGLCSRTEQLQQSVQAAIEHLAKRPVIDRVVLGDIMGATMDLMNKNYGARVPKGWNDAMKRLRAGGPIIWLRTQEETDGHAEQELDQEQL
jgi:hypothetical protein